MHKLFIKIIAQEADRFFENRVDSHLKRMQIRRAIVSIAHERAGIKMEYIVPALGVCVRSAYTYLNHKKTEGDIVIYDIIDAAVKAKIKTIIQ